MKVLIGKTHAGFELSDEAVQEWLKRTNTNENDDWWIERTDPVLIEIYEEKGKEFVSGEGAFIDLREIPDGCKFEIHDYDGAEGFIETWIEVTLEELSKGLSADQLKLAEKVSSIKIATDYNKYALAK
jgi:hypothetical protein